MLFLRYFLLNNCTFFTADSIFLQPFYLFIVFFKVLEIFPEHLFFFHHLTEPSVLIGAYFGISTLNPSLNPSWKTKSRQYACFNHIIILTARFGFIVLFSGCLNHVLLLYSCYVPIITVGHQKVPLNLHNDDEHLLTEIILQMFYILT